VKNAFIDPMALTFDLSTPNHVTFGISQVYSYTKFEHFWIIRFWFMLRTNRQTGRQTDWQTDGLENPTHVARHSLRGQKVSRT